MIEVNFAETIFLVNFFQDMGRISEPFGHAYQRSPRAVIIDNTGE